MSDLEPPSSPDGKDAPPSSRRPGGSFQWGGERWPRTPRVLRWAWAASMTSVVVTGAIGGNDPEVRTMIRLLHRLIEAVEETQSPAPTQTAPSKGPDQ
jgi:hypothetical protein